MNRISCIYAIRNVATNKIYVGKTKNLKYRISSHMSALKNGRHHVPQMQRDHDEFAPEYEVYILCEKDDPLPTFMKDEKFWFAFFNSINDEYGYNVKEKYRKFDISNFVRWSL